MIKRLFLLLICTFSVALVAQEEPPETEQNELAQSTTPHFISDELFIYMHTGPGTNYRIRGSITAGSRINLLERDDESGFSQVSDERGRTGWVKSEFVSPSPSIKVQLEDLKNQLQAQTDSATDYADQVAAMQSQMDFGTQEQESLSTENQALKTEIASLRKALAAKKNEEQKEMFALGAIVVCSGLILGILLTMLFKRRKRSEGFYDRY